MANDNDIQAIQNENIRRVLRNVSPADRATIANFALQSQVVVKNDQYYSKVRIPTTRTGGGPYTYTVPAGTKVSFFSYGQGDPLTPVNFPAATFPKASNVETNLAAKNETNGGEMFVIDGVGFMLDPNTDAVPAKALLGQCYVEAGLQQSGRPYQWGSPVFSPGGGGLFGAGDSLVATPSLLDTHCPVGVVTNGMPGALDYRPLPERILWAPKGQADSTFQADLIFPRAAAFTAIAARAVSAASGGSTGAAAFTPPADLADGTYIDLWCILWGTQFSPRGKNR